VIFDGAEIAGLRPRYIAAFEARQNLSADVDFSET